MEAQALQEVPEEHEAQLEIVLEQVKQDSFEIKWYLRLKVLILKEEKIGYIVHIYYSGSTFMIYNCS